MKVRRTKNLDQRENDLEHNYAPFFMKMKAIFLKDNSTKSGFWYLLTICNKNKDETLTDCNNYLHTWCMTHQVEPLAHGFELKPNTPIWHVHCIIRTDIALPNVKMMREVTGIKWIDKKRLKTIEDLRKAYYYVVKKTQHFVRLEQLEYERYAMTRPWMGLHALQ